MDSSHSTVNSGHTLRTAFLPPGMGLLTDEGEGQSGTIRREEQLNVLSELQEREILPNFDYS